MRTPRLVVCLALALGSSAHAAAPAPRPAVIDISDDDVIRPKKPGSTTITVRDSGLFLTLPIECSDEASLTHALQLIVLDRISSPGGNIVLKHLAKDKVKRPEAAQDIIWALLNSRAFLFNH